MAEFVIVCAYCGQRDKRWAASPTTFKCLHCGSTIDEHHVYHPDKFDIFGYNYVPPEERDNNIKKNLTLDLAEEFERLLKEGEESKNEEPPETD